MTLPIVPIGLFHSSHKEAYRASDIRVTFALLYITYLLEISSFITVAYYDEDWPDVVAQRSIIGFFARNRRHTWLMWIAELLQCKGLFGTFFCSEPHAPFGSSITNLVHSHVKDGWMNYIVDVESYWKFSDSRGHRTLQRNDCEGILREYIEKPFDESIILWHVATDICFHIRDKEGCCLTSAICFCLCFCLQYIGKLFYPCKAVLKSAARVLWWLLEPCKIALKSAAEVLRWLFNRCKGEVKRAVKQSQVENKENKQQEYEDFLDKASSSKKISNYMMHLLFANPEMLMPGSRRNLFTIAYSELEALLQGDDVSRLSEEQITREIHGKLKASHGKGFFYDALDLVQVLRELHEETMWVVICGVWIEMLCFSAGRCRGYLHAKSLGSGGEFLTYISVLMSHAGLETYAERLQRVQLRLLKEERVKIAKQRIQEAANKQATGSSSTPQDMAPVQDQEIGTTPLASQDNGQLEQGEEDAAASTSASRVECVAPEIKIVVSP